MPVFDKDELALQIAQTAWENYKQLTRKPEKKKVETPLEDTAPMIEAYRELICSSPMFKQKEQVPQKLVVEDKWNKYFAELIVASALYTKMSRNGVADMTCLKDRVKEVLDHFPPPTEGVEP